MLEKGLGTKEKINQVCRIVIGQRIEPLALRLLFSNPVPPLNKEENKLAYVIGNMV